MPAPLDLPPVLYTTDQVRELDYQAIHTLGISGFSLMFKAGQVAFNEIMNRWPNLSSITVLCGAGNNGGDGLVIAALALQQGLDVQVVSFTGGSEEVEYEQKLSGEALIAWRWALSLGVTVQSGSKMLEWRGELIVDAMLGTGLSGLVQGPVLEAIEKVNQQHHPVVSIDIPSGLCSDTGHVLGQAVQADLTITFIGVKQGLLTHQAVDHVGKLVFDNLGVPEELYEPVPVSVFRTDWDDLADHLPARKRSSHKGHFGHVLVIGGDFGIGGAAIMAAEAAARLGSGKVSLATRTTHVAASLVRVPEVMAQGVDNPLLLSDLLQAASVLVVGPGLGASAWSDSLMQQVLDTNMPRVLDAGALDYLPQFMDRSSSLSYRIDQQVITPHPGEAARMLGWDTQDVQRDRFKTVRALQERFGGTVVLKGAGTLTYDGDVIHLCQAGNPGMASAGMGDVLSGVIGALLAQGLQPIDAARLGVFLHASAADECALKSGMSGLLATDLLWDLRRLLNARER